MKNNNMKGFAPIIVLVVLLVLIVLATVGSYLVLQKAGKQISLPTSITSFYKPTQDEVTLAKQVLSDSDELTDIESDLEATLVGDPEEDFNDLDSTSTSL